MSIRKLVGVIRNSCLPKINTGDLEDPLLMSESARIHWFWGHHIPHFEQGTAFIPSVSLYTPYLYFLRFLAKNDIINNEVVPVNEYSREK